MSSIMITPMSNRSVNTNSLSSTPDIVPMTQWVPGMGFDTIRAMIMVRQGGATFRAQLAYQSATADADDPDAWTLIDAPRQDGKYCTDDISMSSALSNKYLVRFGLAIWTTTAGTYPAVLSLSVSGK